MPLASLCHVSRRSLLLAGLSLPVVGRAAMSPEPVAVKDLLGTQTFDTVPQRVVALQWDTLDDLLGLGVTPVGVADPGPWPEWVRFPALPAGISDVGTRAEPSIERLLAVKPDLIVAGATQTDLAKKLRAMAPVLCFENSRAVAPLGQAETAIEQFLTLARLFRREAKAREVLDAIETELADWRRRLAVAYPVRPPVQVIRLASLTTAFIYTPNSITAWVVEKLGFTQSLTARNASYGLTQRRLKDFRHFEDTHVVYVRPFAQERKLKESVLWQALPFVRRGHAVPAEAFWSHGGVMSILATARSLGKAFLSLAPGGNA